MLSESTKTLTVCITTVFTAESTEQANTSQFISLNLAIFSLKAIISVGQTKVKSSG